MRLPSNRTLKGIGLPDFDTDGTVRRQAFKSIKHVAGDVTRAKKCVLHYKANPQAVTDRCNVAYCDVCNHQRRKLIIYETTRLIYGKPLYGVHCTVVDNRLRTAQGQLDKLDWQHAFLSISQAVSKSAGLSIKQFIVICSLEFVLCDLPLTKTMEMTAAEKKAARYWQPHFELELLCKYPLKMASKLKNALNLPAKKNQTPLKITRSYCVSRHIAYVTKLKFKRRAPGYDSNGRSKPKWRSLLRKSTAELIEHLGSHLQTERVQIWGRGKTYDKLIKKLGTWPNG